MLQSAGFLAFFEHVSVNMHRRAASLFHRNAEGRESNVERLESHA
jgi:hypothetical protein